jgi:hypothetical protein
LEQSPQLTYDPKFLTIVAASRAPPVRPTEPTNTRAALMILSHCCARSRDGTRRGSSRLLFCLGFEPRHQPVAAPQFKIVAVDKTHCLFDGLGIIGATQRFESYKMLVVSDCICPVF